MGNAPKTLPFDNGTNFKPVQPKVCRIIFMAIRMAMLHDIQGVRFLVVYLMFYLVP